VGIAAFAVANAMALRGRSGQRALVIDLVDLLVATAAIVGPIALLVARPIVTSPQAWLAVPAAVVAIGAVHALGTYALMVLRLPAGHRRNAGQRLVFCSIVLVSAVGQAAQAVSGFTLPAAPFIAVHALCMGGSINVATQALRQTPAGLSRFPPQRQVRKNGLLAALVATSVVLIVAVTAVRRDEGWVVAAALGLLATMAVAGAVRQALLGPETVRLYAEVERAAHERHELLTEVMRYLDSDRPRAAAKLHQQVAVLYTATAWSRGTGADDVFRYVRSDLARRVDAAHQALTAIRGTISEHHGPGPLGALTRAYMSMLYGDDAQPALDVTIDDELSLDWMDEVLAFRVIQLAVHNVWRHAEATTIAVAITAADGALTLVVRDDGVGCDPQAVEPGTGLLAMRALADLADGHVTLDSSPGAGACLRAVIGSPAPPPGASPPEGRRPALRLVT
jgi:signal transduction histidine kinase